MRDVLARVQPRKQTQHLQATQVLNQADIEHAVVRPRLGHDAHAAGVAGAVPDDHQKRARIDASAVQTHMQAG
jgi:hypothetical protein